MQHQPKIEKKKEKKKKKKKSKITMYTYNPPADDAHSTSPPTKTE